MEKFRFIKKAIACSLFSAMFALGYCASAEEIKPSENTNTELVFVVDKSGSMHGLTKDTIGSYNSVIEEQKKSDKKGEIYVTTVFFNQNHSKIHDRKNIKDIDIITDQDYRPSGCTALLDAVGDTITSLSKSADIKKNKVLFVIITDGLENSSKEYTKNQVKELIDDKTKNDKWKFIFLGANIDSVSTASELGINAKCARNFAPSGRGIREAYECVSYAIDQRKNGKEIDLNEEKKKAVSKK